MPFDQMVTPVDLASSAPGRERQGASEASSVLNSDLKGCAESRGPFPSAALDAWEDWALHLSMTPGRQVELWRLASEAMFSLWRSPLLGGSRADWAFPPDPADRRFRNPGWSQPPFSVFAAAQLAAEAQWRAAASPLRGVADDHIRRVEFLGRFALNALAPVNFASTNPQVLEAAWRTGGMNFAAGAALLARDFLRLSGGGKAKGLDIFKVGETTAVTKGEVIFRNELMELIQYAPTTPQVRREPLLITPAWLMKYYVLDLTPANSLVRYLVDRGFTVFIISWKNPGPEMKDTAFDDYRRKGVLAAIDAVGKVVPGEKIHAVGYCLGGTLLAITAAAMGRDDDDRLASVTLFAAQTNFDVAGDLMLFLDEGQLTLLKAMMQVRGYFDPKEVGAAFSVLRANEMVFARLVERYLLGESAPPTDMDAWLADPTRIPARTHGEYLRIFLDNSFAEGALQIDGRPVAPRDIRTPVFALGAERDQVAPWRSIHRMEFRGAADVTFVLTGGGHNTGVVSPPGKPGAYYRVDAKQASDAHVDPDAWLAATRKQEGSWWPEWVRWLDQRSSIERHAPPTSGCHAEGLIPLAPAPGCYALEA